MKKLVKEACLSGLINFWQKNKGKSNTEKQTKRSNGGLGLSGLGKGGKQSRPSGQKGGGGGERAEPYTNQSGSPRPDHYKSPSAGGGGEKVKKIVESS